MIADEKPVQQKLRKIHPNLESQIKFELNKLLKAKIIFPVQPGTSQKEKQRHLDLY